MAITRTRPPQRGSIVPFCARAPRQVTTSSPSNPQSSLDRSDLRKAIAFLGRAYSSRPGPSRASPTRTSIWMVRGERAPRRCEGAQACRADAQSARHGEKLPSCRHRPSPSQRSTRKRLRSSRPLKTTLSSVTLHAGRHEDRPAGLGAERARVGLEPKVELPERSGATGLGGDVVRVTAVADGRHSAVLADLLQVAPGAGALQGLRLECWGFFLGRDSFGIVPQRGASLRGPPPLLRWSCGGPPDLTPVGLKTGEPSIGMPSGDRPEPVPGRYDRMRSERGSLESGRVNDAERGVTSSRTG